MNAAALQPALDVSRVSKSFGGVQAIKNVSLQVACGSVTALIGPNGAGKTTLFNLITCVLPLSAGTIYLHGERIDRLSLERIAARGLIRTFQSARVFPGMTVVENVMTGAHRRLRAATWQRALCLPVAISADRELRRRAEKLLDITGLLSLRDQPASDLPMGSQKLLEVVRALMASPRLLLLDEPAAGLNDSETAELAGLVRAIRAVGTTVLIVEHNMALVMGVADQVVVLDAGRMMACGAPEDVRADNAVIKAYLGNEEAS